MNRKITLRCHSLRGPFSLLAMTILCSVEIHAQTWKMSTEDTVVELKLSNNSLSMTSLRQPTNPTDWIAVPTRIPMPSVQKAPEHPTAQWTFLDAQEDRTNGYRLTLRFHCTDPALELTSVWRALPGPGPVENEVTVVNRSEGKVVFLPTPAAEIALSADAPLTVHRVEKTSVGIGKVVEEPLTANAKGKTNSEWIPLLFLGAENTHGAYLGFEWELGGFQWTAADPSHVTCSIRPITESVTREPEGIFRIPAIYYGVYQGDLDDGSNRFKRWFWNHKITRSLHDNVNEPWVEVCIQELTKAGASISVTGNAPQSAYDLLASVGAECVKLDYPDGTGKCWYTNRDWNFRPEVWPQGFDFAIKAHKAGLKASLYMGGTYNDADLNTLAGRDAELTAVMERYDKGWFDMWRTDRYTAPMDPMPSTYEGVANFLHIQDQLIANRPGYRYENCCNGGKYKGFAIGRRMTFCTMNDNPNNPVQTRTTYFSNTYAINPVQLKSDLGPASTAYVMRTHMLGAILSAATDNPVYRQHIALYKERQRPILRGANVYHILPMADGIHWDGLQYFNPDLRKGSVFLFKPVADAPDHKVIRLKGLKPEIAYTLHFQDRQELDCVRTGRQLMANGIHVTGMLGAQASEIIWIEETPGATPTPEPEMSGKRSSIPLRDDQQLPAALREGLLYWADANENVYVDSTGKVLLWKDARESGDGDTQIRAAQWAPSARPALVTGGVEMNNLRLVDFGSWHKGDAGMWMPWSYPDEKPARLTPAMVFMVVSCPNGSGFLLGDLEHFDFHPVGYEKPPAVWFWRSGNQGKNGILYLNGQKVDATTAKVSTGVEVATIVAPKGAVASNFLKDRVYNVGGGRIGEVLIYAKQLDDNTRKMVEEYLMNKWLPGRQP